MLEVNGYESFEDFSLGKNVHSIMAKLFQKLWLYYMYTL